MRSVLMASALCASLCLGSVSAQAAPILDPAGDFLPTLDPGAPRAGDLDVISSEVLLLSSSLLFTATLAAPLNTTAEAFYVFGVDRGAGATTANFAQLGLPDIMFDAVVILQNEGTGVVNRLAGGGTSPLAAGSVTISGNTIQALVPLVLLPSLGFTPDQYGWNLWPRWGGIPFSDPQIADFAPDDRNQQVTAVPEPSTLMLLGLGLATGLRARARRRAA